MVTGMDADQTAFLSLALEFIRTVAIVAGAVFIPLGLHWAARASDRQRTTLELSRDIFTEPLILGRMENSIDTAPISRRQPRAMTA